MTFEVLPAGIRTEAPCFLTSHDDNEYIYYQNKTFIHNVLRYRCVIYVYHKYNMV